VLNQLFKHTSMQESFSMIFLAVVNAQPKEMGLIQAIQHFIDHRIDVVRRRTAFLLQKAKDREHILEGLAIALDNLQTVVTIIRLSVSRAEARENLRIWSTGGITDKGWLLYHRSAKPDRNSINEVELLRLVGVENNLRRDATGFVTNYRFGFFLRPNAGFVSGKD